MSLEGAIAAHRFGLGARPGEIDSASRSPKAWLMAQIDRPGEQPKSTDGQPLLNAGQLLKIETQYKVDRFMSKGHAAKDDPKAGKVQNVRKEQYLHELGARYALGFTTERPLRRASRLVLEQSLHRLRARTGGALCRRLRARGHPSPHHRHVRGHAAGGLHPSGDADLSLQFPLDRPEFVCRRQVGQGPQRKSRPRI